MINKEILKMNIIALIVLIILVVIFGDCAKPIYRNTVLDRVKSDIAAMDSIAASIPKPERMIKSRTGYEYNDCEITIEWYRYIPITKKDSAVQYLRVYEMLDRYRTAQLLQDQVHLDSTKFTFLHPADGTKFIAAVSAVNPDNEAFSDTASAILPYSVIIPEQPDTLNPPRIQKVTVFIESGPMPVFQTYVNIWLSKNDRYSCEIYTDSPIPIVRTKITAFGKTFDNVEGVDIEESLGGNDDIGSSTINILERYDRTTPRLNFKGDMDGGQYNKLSAIVSIILENGRTKDGSLIEQEDKLYRAVLEL